MNTSPINKEIESAVETLELRYKNYHDSGSPMSKIEYLKVGLTSSLNSLLGAVVSEIEEIGFRKGNNLSEDLYAAGFNNALTTLSTRLKGYMK